MAEGEERGGNGSSKVPCLLSDALFVLPPPLHAASFAVSVGMDTMAGGMFGSSWSWVVQGKMD